MVVKDLLASVKIAVRFVRQSLASDCFVLELDVFQLVFELGDVLAFYNLGNWGEDQLKHKIVEEGLGVRDSGIFSSKSFSAFFPRCHWKFSCPPPLSGSWRGPRSGCPRAASCPAPPARGNGPPRS